MRLNAICLSAYLLFCMACGEKDVVESAPSFSFEYLDEYKLFKLDYFTSYNFDVYHFNAEQGILTFFNSLDRSIFLYSIDQETPLAKVKVEREGPNGVPAIDAVFTQSLDSIFIFSELSGNGILSIIDVHGNLIAKDQLTLSSNGDPTFPKLGKKYGLSYAYPNVFLTTVPGFQTTLENRKSLLIFNLNSKERMLSVELPHTYAKSLGSTSFGQFTGATFGVYDYIHNQYLTGYAFDDDLVLSDLKYIPPLTRRKQVKNARVKLPAPSFNYKNATTYESRKYAYGNSWYQGLAFDPKHKVFIRSASIGVDWTPSHNEEFPDFDRDFSVNGDKNFFYWFLYDKDLNFIGQVPDMDLMVPILFTHDGPFRKVSTYEGTEAVSMEDYLIFRKFRYLPDSLSN